jgi:hypothetical protein
MWYVVLTFKDDIFRSDFLRSFNFKFPAKHVCCHVPLISDVIFWNSVMDNNSNEMGLVAYNFEPESSEEEMT